MVGEGEGGVGSLGNSWLIYDCKDSYSYADKIEKRSDNSPHTWSYYLLPVEKVSHSQLRLVDLLPHTLCDFHVYIVFCLKTKFRWKNYRITAIAVVINIMRN